MAFTHVLLEVHIIDNNIIPNLNLGHDNPFIDRIIFGHTIVLSNRISTCKLFDAFRLLQAC